MLPSFHEGIANHVISLPVSPFEAYDNTLFKGKEEKASIFVVK
jgi:hypothetical protein